MLVILTTMVFDLRQKVELQLLRRSDECSVAVPPTTSLCPHCGSDIVPWVFFKGRWWKQVDGKWLFLEDNKKWASAVVYRQPTPDQVDPAE